MINNKNGTNLTNVQEMNRALILRNLRECPNISRADLAKKTGLQQATITNIINDLISFGLVRENGLIKNQRGRRSIGLTLDSTHYKIIALRLTRSYLLGGIFDILGNSEKLISETIDVNEGALCALEKIKVIIQSLIAHSPTTTFLAIGIGVPGLFVKPDGCFAMVSDFPGWESVLIAKELEKEFEIPILFEHDAYASALAEWWFDGHGVISKTLLSLSMEQGIGAGLVVDGNVYYGTQGIAGEIGHLSIDYNGIPCSCGRKGCLRNYCTGKALVQQAVELLKEHPESKLNGVASLNKDTIIESAMQGDHLAINLITHNAQYLAYGLITAIYMYNPDTIVLSAEFSAAGDLYLNAIRTTLKQQLQPIIYQNVSLSFSKLNTDTVLMGIVALVSTKIFEDNSSIFNKLSSKG